MRALTQETRADLARPVAVVAVVLVAGVLNGYALGSDAALSSHYLWASVAAAVPIGVLFAVLAELRPSAALLGLVGLLAGSLALAAASARSVGADPLPVAFGCVLALGFAMALSGRGRLRDVLEGILLAYVGLAFIFEMSVPLHNL
ncbi:MAG: hypothetical protein ABSB34_02095 [Candidatus Limnocylindrales bacterium]|jgi:peptidoglycan/LPS O-acetylase OafA/YrhL